MGKDQPEEDMVIGLGPYFNTKLAPILILFDPRNNSLYQGN